MSEKPNKAELSSRASRVLLRKTALDLWLPSIELKVLDIGAGEGHVWSAIKKVRSVPEYTAVDKKPQMAGTLQADVTTAWISSQSLWKYDVIDFDLYEFKAWELYLYTAMTATKPLVVFITPGKPGKSKGGLSNDIKMVLGIPMDWQVPDSKELSAYAASECLSRGAAYAKAKEVLMVEQKGVMSFAVRFPGK